MTLIERIEMLFDQHAHRLQDSPEGEPISALNHALQTAQLAEWAGADASLVAAALLHDLPRFTAAPGAGAEHAEGIYTMLTEGFSPEVVEPIRLHVQAKRYLAATDPAYAEQLPADSRRALQTQGGPMSAGEIAEFESLRFSPEAVQLRRWIDAAKVPGKPTPPLAYYLTVLDQLIQQPVEDTKIGIGPVSVV
jgi:predicted HD phosphohydrolase